MTVHTQKFTLNLPTNSSYDSFSELSLVAEEDRCFFERLFDRKPFEAVDELAVACNGTTAGTISLSHLQQSSSEHEDPESNTSKSNSAAVVLGPGLGSSC